jgi:hypothetical protein
VKRDKSVKSKKSKRKTRRAWNPRDSARVPKQLNAMMH